MKIITGKMSYNITYTHVKVVFTLFSLIKAAAAALNYWFITICPCDSPSCPGNKVGIHPEWDTRAVHTHPGVTIPISISIDLFSSNSTLALFSEHVYLHSKCVNRDMWIAAVLIFAVRFIRA